MRAAATGPPSESPFLLTSSRTTQVDYADDSHGLRPDLAALAAAAHANKAALVYIANPDNPTGFVHSPAAIAELRSALPAESTVPNASVRVLYAFLSSLV